MKIKFLRIIYNKKQLTWDWSGTVTSLKKSLNKYAEVEENNIFINFFDKAIKKIRKNDFNLSVIKKASKKVESKKGIFLNFDEFPMKEGNKEISTYIYQDLCVEYLLDISRSDRVLFENSGFQDNSFEVMKKRKENQDKFYSDVNQVFTMGNWLREYMINNNIVKENQISHVGAGINISSLSIDYSLKEGNKFLFVGKDFKRKAGDLVYKAFLEIQKEYPDVELYIIGPQKIPFSPDNDKIHFIGEVSTEKLSYYFNLCDYFVMPSRFEAYGLVFIEALTYGLPCIGRKLQEMPYLIEENKTGYLIEKYEEDPKVLAKYMKKLLDNEEIRNSVRNKKEEYIEYYSWDRVAKNIVEIIKKTRN